MERGRYVCVLVCVVYLDMRWFRWLLMAQEDAGMIVTDQDVMKKIRVKKSSTELSLTTPLASLLKREKQPNEIEGRGGPYRDTTPKRQRDKE